MTKGSPEQSIDQAVGRRLRLRRRSMGLSQSALAAHLQVSFQQVQKYERGSNRISASKLFRAAAALNVQIGYFFAELPDPADGPCEAIELPPAGLYETDEGQALAAVFPAIGSARARRAVLAVAAAFAADVSGTEAGQRVDGGLQPEEGVSA